MNRRRFLKLIGLGAAGASLPPQLTSAAGQPPIADATNVGFGLAQIKREGAVVFGDPGLWPGIKKYYGDLYSSYEPTDWKW